MKISLQVALGYFLIVGLAAWFVLNVFMAEVKPGVRQAEEETLVDTANLLAELATPDLKAGRIADGGFARAVRAYSGREVSASIWDFRKNTLDYRIYVTDAAGIVVFASDPSQVGRDYSRWRDVYLTLQGKYGARSTRDDPADDTTSVMHVAAPVRDGGKLIGVVTVAKPNVALQPFIERSQRKIRDRGLLLLAAAALIGAWFTWRLTRSINRLRRYARDVSEGRKATPPESGSSEIAELASALETMREKLEGKHYVEQYVHTLTHEMKSPLAAIQGAAELLDEDMPRDERRRFAGNIREQSERLRQLADKMLNLAQVEQRQSLEAPEELDLAALAREALELLAPRLQVHDVQVDVQVTGPAVVRGERFLLRQALVNLLENAIDFSPPGGRIQIGIDGDGQRVDLTVRDHGPGIPDFALDKVFDRFYSLARPGSGRKGTGLGLSFVREIALLHQGSVSLGNHPEGGAVARLTLPASP